MDTLELIRHRISANKFDTTRGVSEDEIRDLVFYATQAPSSFNQQHWRFVAVIAREAKERLRAVTLNQQKVVDAAVTFIVLGDLRAHEKMPQILERSAAAGLIDRGAIERSLKRIVASYEDEIKRRDEAIRSASLAAMTLMIAAEAKGLASGPMIGFDPQGVKREFNISDRYVPVMLVAVGYPAAGNSPRKPRLEVDEVLAFNDGSKFVR
jgi:nitroreductase